MQCRRLSSLVAVGLVYKAYLDAQIFIPAEAKPLPCDRGPALVMACPQRIGTVG